MNCKKCGLPLTAEDKFCRNCGAAVDEGNAPLNQDLSNNNNNRFIFENQNNNNMPNNGNNFQNYSQPMNNNVNAYSEPMNNYNNMNYGNNKNNNSTRNIIFIIAGVIVAIVIVVLAVIAIMKFTGKDNNTNTPNSGSDTNTTGTPTTNVASSYKVSFMKFTFTIPDTMDYEIKDDSLLIADLDGTWVIQMMLMNSDFNSLKANRYKIPSALAEQGMTASTPEVKTIGGHDYITLETYKSGERCIVAFTAVNSSNTALIVAANQDYEIDYSILQKITPIITSATYENSTSNMESPNEFNIDINSITELAQ